MPRSRVLDPPAVEKVYELREQLRELAEWGEGRTINNGSVSKWLRSVMQGECCVQWGELATKGCCSRQIHDLITMLR